jgi:hypothetical protein
MVFDDAVPAYRPVLVPIRRVGIEYRELALQRERRVSAADRPEFGDALGMADLGALAADLLGG